MIRKVIATSLLSASVIASGICHADPLAEPIIPKAGFFVGVGGGYNSFQSDQYLNASSNSNVFTIVGPPIFAPDDGPLVAFGSVSGSANPYHGVQSKFSPMGQVGYFNYFRNTSWLLGGKFLYQYLGISATNNNVDSSFTPSNFNLTPAGAGVLYYGNLSIQSMQTTINHELAFIPFVGHMFGRFFVYAGVGPALFQSQSNIYQATGYIDINGIHADVTGTPNNFSSSQWTWGGAGQLGATFYLDSSWFFDLNYTYATTAQFSSNYSTTFLSASDGLNDEGTLNVSTGQRLTNETLMLSINKVF